MMTRRLPSFALVTLAVAGFAALVVWSGFARIAAGLTAIGWALPGLVLLRLAALVMAGIAWGVVLGPPARGQTCRLVGLRLVREAINALLPVGQVGGDLIGARLLARRGIEGRLALAGILVDILLQVASQAAYAAAGLLTLWLAFGDRPLVREAGAGLILAVPALAGFFLVQRLGLFALGERLAVGFGWLAPGTHGDAGLRAAFSRLYARPGILALGFVLHLTAWIFGIGEIWLALNRLGVDPGLAMALVLDSLGQAVRSAGFAVPWALGVQEGGFVALGVLFGLDPALAVALSIAKRLPDLAIGLPGLVAWRRLEQVDRARAPMPPSPFFTGC